MSSPVPIRLRAAVWRVTGLQPEADSLGQSRRGAQSVPLGSGAQHLASFSMSKESRPMSMNGVVGSSWSVLYPQALANSETRSMITEPSSDRTTVLLRCSRMLLCASAHGEVDGQAQHMSAVPHSTGGVPVAYLA